MPEQITPFSIWKHANKGVRGQLPAFVGAWEMCEADKLMWMRLFYEATEGVQLSPQHAAAREEVARILAD